MRFLSSFTLILLLSFNAFANDFIDKEFKFSYGKYSKSKFSDTIAVINWHSEEGIKRFERTHLKGDFFRLAHHFKPQRHPATCGIAASAIVLRGIYEKSGKKFPLLMSMPITIGEKVYGLDYRDINEDNFFNDQTDKVMPRLAIQRMMRANDGEFSGGIDIAELSKMLKIHDVGVKIKLISDVSESLISEFRDEVISVVQDKDRFIIANYSHDYKSGLGAHYSPVVAYDKESDSVLIMDVAAHREPWVWINLKDVYLSMHTKNYAGNSYRGYMIISGNLK